MKFFYLLCCLLAVGQAAWLCSKTEREVHYNISESASQMATCFDFSVAKPVIVWELHSIFENKDVWNSLDIEEGKVSRTWVGCVATRKYDTLSAWELYIDASEEPTIACKRSD